MKTCGSDDTEEEPIPKNPWKKNMLKQKRLSGRASYEHCGELAITWREISVKTAMSLSFNLLRHRYCNMLLHKIILGQIYFKNS